MGKILIIDDERPTLDMFQLLLGALGYEVLVAENGAEGLEVFEREFPPIVITDIKMPGMDGLEVLRRIKALREKTAVIVITGHGEIDLALQALDLNVIDFINKPVQRPALESALRRAQASMKPACHEKNAIEIREVNTIKVIEVNCRLELQAEGPLSGALTEAYEQGFSKVVVVFDELSIINGAGIAMLIRLLALHKDKGQRIAICGPSENFVRIFDIFGIRKVADIFNEVEAAINSLSGVR